MVIETELPRRACVGGVDYLTVAEREFPAFGGRWFSLREGSAEWLIVELNGPIVRGGFECADRLLAAECFEIVVNDLLGRREFLLCRRLVSDAGQQQENGEKSNGYTQKLYFFFDTFRAAGFFALPVFPFGFR